MVAGRTNEGRTATVSTTLSSTAITGAAGTFHEEDAGRTITGTNIPAAATLASVQSDTAATLSAAATATGAGITATLGRATGEAYGFTGWSPETDPESETYTVAAANAGTVTPDRVTTSIAPKSAQRARG